MKNRPLRALTEGALMIAVAQILSYLNITLVENGGAIDLAMIPIILYAVRWGLVPGLLAGMAFGTLQFVFLGIAISWQSILGDYLIAFGAIGLAALPRHAKYGIFYGTLVGCVARFLVHFIVGATVWAAYMPDTFFNLTMISPWFYSALYNLSFMLPNTALALLVFALMHRKLHSYLVPVK